MTTPIPGVTPIAYAAAVLPGGKVVLAGQTTTSAGDGQILVTRYRRNGRLDRAFGSQGIFRTTLPAASGPFIATSVARQGSSGKLLVGGGYGQGSMLVLRLTRSGRLDRAFGGNRTGLAQVPAGGIAEALAVQRGGRILLGGSNANSNGRPMVVARFTHNGGLDRRFGSAGLAEAMFWNPDLAASAGVTGLATTPSGGVIAAGHLDYIGGDGHGSAGVFRLTSSGQPVQGFGSSGHTEVAFTQPAGGFAQWFPCGMIVDSRGRITVTGDGSTGSGGAILSTRLTRRGALDQTFGAAGNGRVVTPGGGSGNDTTCGAAAGPAGGLTVGVGSALAQLGPNGARNRRFARGGLINIARPRNVAINAVERTSSGRLVVAGTAGNSIYVARYRLPR